MGCDIHFYVERRVDGAWVTADKWTRDADYPSELSNYPHEFYDSRSYGLFAILADVRNDFGITPIAPPRGVPEDACAEYRAKADEQGGDGHSHSWFTVAELLKFDWLQTAEYEGVVDPIGWARVRDYPKDGPGAWSGSVGGGGVKHFAPIEFEAAWERLRVERGYPEGRYPSAHLREIGGGSYDLDRFNEILDCRSAYTRVSWTRPYYKAAGSDFWGETIPRLLSLGALEDVRICFFFDN